MYLVEDATQQSEQLDGSQRARRLTVDSSQEEYLLVLQSQLQIPERPLSSCVLAGASGRAYPLAYSDSNAGAPLFPLPDNELERLGAMSRARLTEVRNLPELELICNLASRELHCRTAMVTLISHDTQYILATNNPVFRNSAGPRDQALCAHTIMGPLPMLAPHTAADVRFSRSQLVLRGGLRFYFGFPSELCAVWTANPVVYANRSTKLWKNSLIAPHASSPAASLPTMTFSNSQVEYK
ncbi:hypothetical protein PR001_g25085 [Phytophthora rubi]|nr:hypothetical protein PR001_g25085 [Phytophthora rubi]KAE8978204.1 hypothetical protein PR002_g24783 [Phytophthora rubi]